MAPNHARKSNTDDDYDGADRSGPSTSATFAQMLELSSLGSAEARAARRDGAKVLDELGARQAPWHTRPPAWVDVAELHTQMAEYFDNQQQSEITELWLRAALLRSLDAATATWLAVTLEQRRDLSQAYIWYLRAAEQGDVVAAGRLAVTSQIAGRNELAGLLLSIGSSTITASRRAAANELMNHLSRARTRHRSELISQTPDTDLVFWVGCLLYCSARHRSLAGECFSAAVARGHRVAATTFFDVTEASSTNPTDDGPATVRSIADKLGRAIHGEPTGDAIPLDADSSGTENRDVPDEWIAAAMAGDRAAVERVLGVIRPLVVRYCHARLGTSTGINSDDIAQEVCLAVLTALPGYRVQGRPFLAFVYGIASHKVIDAYRAAQRDRSDLSAASPEHTDDSPTPETRALQVELSQEMSKLLETLPEKHREIITLRVVVGLSAEETAEAVGSTPGAVRVVQHRALTRLRKDLADRAGSP